MERLPFRATAGAAAYANLHLPATIMLDNVRSMYNVGSFFRTADGAALSGCC
jgi:tRNA G18 (ribose-2'-O)-methylase SpoU